jgi:C1A family cysteine protease
MVSQNHPVIINVIADNSFIAAKTGFIWKTYSGSGSLPHCIVICGYDDAKNAYLIMNSWGTAWGDAGFTWIDYDFFLTEQEPIATLLIKIIQSFTNESPGLSGAFLK